MVISLRFDEENTSRASVLFGGHTHSGLFSKKTRSNAQYFSVKNHLRIAEKTFILSIDFEKFSWIVGKVFCTVFGYANNVFNTESNALFV